MARGATIETRSLINLSIAILLGTSQALVSHFLFLFEFAIVLEFTEILTLFVGMGTAGRRKQCHGDRTGVVVPLEGR